MANDIISWLNERIKTTNKIIKGTKNKDSKIRKSCQVTVFKQVKNYINTRDYIND